MSWTPLLRFTLGQADINDNRNFLQCENDNDADQMRHTYCINNMKQNTLTWVILHTANHPQCKHNRAVSLKWNPHSPAGPAGGVLGRGQAEVTQVVLLLFHRPRSGWADDPGQTWSLGRFWNTCPDSTRSNRHRTASKPLWYHSYLRIPRLNPDSKPARADTLLHTFTRSALFKESFNWFKAVFKRERRHWAT